MAKLLFKPFSIATGLLAGIASKKAFELIWSRIDDREDAPQPDRRYVGLGKLALALGLEGALFRMVKGLVDHGSRRAFAGVTGAWPGEEQAFEEEDSSKR
jgi:Protein of unknown function (DUF4235)